MRSKRLFTIFFSVFSFLFLSEFLVRTFAPQVLISDVIDFDDAPCHRLKKNAIGIQSSIDYDIEIKTNSFGLRDYEISSVKNDDTFRILLLGDSHTFGWGVDLDSTFVKIVERNLNLLRDDRQYQVINAGAMGYSLGHDYQFLTSTGYDLNPDLVIIAMDLYHDLLYDTRYFYLHHGKIIRNEVPCTFRRTRSMCKYIPFCSYLRGHSHLFRFSGLRLLSLFNTLKSKPDSPASTNDSEFYKHDVTNNILKQIKHELQSRGLQFAVIIVPELGVEIDHDLKLMRNFLTKEKIDYAVLQDDWQQHDYPETLIFENDLHFNSKGHRFIAYLITDFLLKNSRLLMGNKL